MTPETLRGVLLIVGIGVAVLAVAMYADWRSAQKAREALEQVPARADDPAGELPAPSYVDSETAHRPGSVADTLTDEQRGQLAAGGDSVIEVDAQVTDTSFKTHHDPDAMVLFNARVLCCPEGVGSVREVIGTLERCARDKSAIVLVGPTFDPEVVDLLVVNIGRGTLSGGALTASAGDCVALATALGGSAVTRADLQSGYLPYSSYGHAGWLTADDRTARFVPRSAPPERQDSGQDEPTR